MTPLGIYIHIPFCLSKCAYCDFYSKVGTKTGWREYTAALISHIGEAKMKHSDYVVDSIYFGGGTPTAIGAKNLIKILNAVYKNFKIKDDCEITTEANPNTVNASMLKSLFRAGVNRISFGMQSSKSAELRTLGRTHTFDDVKAAVDAAHEAGIQNVSLDLMYGIPFQTLETFYESLDAAIGLGATHISCYCLKIEPGTPLAAEDVQTLDLPDEDTVADMYLAAVDKLKSAGFAQYEISNFAKEGCDCRHNKKYWTLGDYWGFGPSAHSLIGKKRFSYIRDISRYIEALREHDEVIDRIETISVAERTGEYLMLGLRTSDGISPDFIERRCMTDFEEIEKVLLKYSKSGYTEFDGVKWVLTPEGFLISNRIIGDVLDALERSKHIVTPLGGYARK